jgi:ABC-type branched-subunit amino acid transport system substrate-binding protein
MRVFQSVIFVLESSICFRTALAFLHDDVTFTHRKLLEQRNKTLIIGSLLGGDDTYTLSKEIFECTISLINDHSDGWYDDLLKDVNISYRIEDANCNESATIHSYENIRDIIDVVIGPMCSASAMASGWLTTEDKKVQVSQAASSVRLSDKEEFPYVSRLVAPDNENGEVGALVAALKGFGWNRVSVIYTDSPFANDYVKEFTKIWTNRSISNESYISSSQKVTLLENDMLDKDSGRKAITNLMDLKISEKARVILLVAYLGEAKSILELAKDMNFQPDTIWVAVSTWCDMELPQAIQFNSGKHPGYIGVTPFRNRDSRFQVYWERFQSRCNEENRTKMPNYYSENLVDAVVAALLAFNTTPRRLWKNATKVTKNLRALEFDGVSGRVSFTNEGDRKNPVFSIYNLQMNKAGKLVWEIIGNVEKNGNFTINEAKEICFAGSFGCNKEKKFPSDKYPQDLEWWVFALSGLCVLFALALFSSFLFWVKWLRSNHSILEMNKRIESLRKLNREISTLDKGKKSDRSRRQELFQRRDTLTDAPPITWSDSTESLLVEVQPHEEQYSKVLEKLRQGMNDANISKLWRVQNISLWTYYSFHKLRLTINDIDHNEKDVWHGTSDIDPAVIYNDTQDGFMMQFARSGSWG